MTDLQDQPLVNQIKALPLKTLLALGFNQVTAQQKLDELNIAINGAIIDDVLKTLTPAEATKLKTDLTAGPVNADTVTQKLKNACLSSTNKPDVDKLANDSRVRVINNFWAGIGKKVSPQQSEKALEIIQKHLKTLDQANKT